MKQIFTLFPSYQIKRMMTSLVMLSFSLLCFFHCSESGVGSGCPIGYDLCDGFCVSFTADSNHCGGCGFQCAEGQSCTDAMCTGGGGVGGELMCTDDQEACGVQCVNIMNDRNHCGGCNNVCGGSSICKEGLCACGDDLQYCQSECVNINTDSRHCGQCANPCLESQRCFQGMCTNQRGEICNDQDDDLDGVIDEAEDGQTLTRTCNNLCGDGEEVCNQGEFVNCSAPEPTTEECNTQDDDCDGLVDEGTTQTFFEDRDRDGYGSTDLGKAIEACTDPGVGYSSDPSDCNDERPDIYVGAQELCDGVDNNCNRTSDEGCDCTDGDILDCGSNEGICQVGTQVCQRGILGECGGSGYIPPEVEVCDGIDNDCDALIDEALPVDPREGEGNNACNRAHILPPIDEGDYLRVANTNLYNPPGVDIDWYRVLAEESGNLGFDDLECFNRQDQCFTFLLEFTPPPNSEPQDLIACVSLISDRGRACSANNFTVCSDASPEFYDMSTNKYQLGIKWSGLCGLSDSKEFLIEIRGRTEQISDCDAYQMKFDFNKVNPDFCAE